MNYYKKIKTEIINNEITKKIKDHSKNMIGLSAYYNIGKLLSGAGKHYGEGIIKEYSNKLSKEFGKGYSTRNLRNLRQFYLVFKNWQTLSANLTWSHYCEILWFKKPKFLFYQNLCLKYHLSIRQLRERIKNNEYERLDDQTKQKLIEHKETKAEDFIKNPIVIRNSFNYEIISEKILQKLILENIESFMKEKFLRQ